MRRKSRRARQVQEIAVSAMADRSHGVADRSLKFGAQRAGIVNITDSRVLPAQLNDGTQGQDASGNFYFMVGYSQIQGGDIIP